MGDTARWSAAVALVLVVPAMVVLAAPVVGLDGTVAVARLDPVAATAHRFEVAVLDERDRVVAHGATLVAGDAAAVPLPELGRLDEQAALDLPWYRLLWSVTSAAGAELAGGIEPVAAVAPDALSLDLGVIAGPWLAGTTTEVWVRTANPLTGVAVGGVTVELASNDAEATLAAVTGEDGFARVQVPVAATADAQLTLRSRAVHGPFRGAAEVDLWALPGWRSTLAVDRIWHRPGETLRWRALALAPELRAMDGLEVNVEVTDRGGEVVHAATSLTSALGVAHGEWQIPADLEPGEYDLEARIDDGVTTNEHEVELRIAPYELPPLEVAVEVQQPFVLPGEKAAAEIEVRTFAGAPVAGALVEIVGGADWWWDPDEDEDLDNLKWSGVSDDSGRTTAALDLSESHEDLAEHGYRRWEDVEFETRATDPATLRVVRQPFRVRASLDPVHVYCFDDGPQVEGHPGSVWIATFSAGGEPLACAVELRLVDDDGTVLESVASGATGRWGATRLAISTDAVATIDELDGDLEAVADCGARGRGAVDDIWWDPMLDDDVLRVEPAHSVLAAGEPIEAMVLAPPGVSSATVVATVGARPVSRVEIVVVDGRGAAVLPYDERLRGRVVVTATGAATPRDAAPYDWLVAGQVGVLYPDPARPQLELAATPSPAAPGAKVALDLRLDRGGADAAGIVGLVAVDRAYEEVAAEGWKDWVRAGFTYASTATFGDGSGSHAGWTVDRLLAAGDAARGAELEPVARLVLGSDMGWAPDDGRDWRSTSSSLYAARVKATAEVFAQVLDRCSGTTGRECWASANELEAQLAAAGTPLALALDPWGRPLTAAVTARGSQRLLHLASAGPDGEPDSGDDFGFEARRWPWFGPSGGRVQQALERWWEGHPAGVVSEAEVCDALADAGIDVASWRDPWDRSMELEVTLEGCQLNAVARSWGDPNRTWFYRVTDDDRTRPPVRAWTASLDTFAGRWERLERALKRRLAAGDGFPANEAEIGPVLEEAGFSPTDRLDLHGRELRLRVDTQLVFANAVGVGPEGHVEAQPVRRVERSLVITSAGIDGRWGSRDDVRVARIDGPALELQVLAPQPDAELAELLGLDDRSGALLVRTTDGSTVPVPGVTVTASREGSPEVTAISDAEGRATLRLPSGDWSLVCQLAGFDPVTLTVPVAVGQITSVIVELHGAELAEIVVSSEAPVVETTSTTVGRAFEAVTNYTVDGIEMSRVGESSPGEAAAEQRGDFDYELPRRLATPRVRTDFRETALWAPEVELGADGRAELDFNLPDAVTTWRVQAVASTADGRVAEAEALLPAPLPLELRLDLPPVLTTGDRLELPLAVRHDLAGPQQVELAATASGAVTLAGDPVEVTAVPATWARATFPLTAVGEGEATVRATGRTHEAADGVELPVAVHPLAEEAGGSAAAVVRSGGRLSLELPAGVTPESLRLDVDATPAARIERALLAQLERPAWCAEQIASLGLAWQLLADVLDEGPDDANVAARLAAARTRVRFAITRLEERVGADGGVAYWKGGTPSEALSARVLELAAAAAFDDPRAEALAERVAGWLASRQLPDGGWGGLDPGTALPLTAVVARALAEASDPAARAAAERAVDLLAIRLGQLAEPFATASLALAADALGRDELAARMVTALEDAVRWEDGAAYWHLDLNLPLGGWGRPGRLEATAAAVEALAELGGDSALVEAGARFLLAHGDLGGGWYSTAATLATIRALLAAGLDEGVPGGRLDVCSGNEVVAAFELDPAQPAVSVPLPPDTAEVELVRHDGDQPLLARLQGRWWRPWPDDGSPVRGPDAGNLAFDVRCDSAEVQVGDEILCTLHAERTAFRGFGMLLAELGLPPGAEVDTAALEGEVGGRYELRPDRVVFYLWPWAEGETVTVRYRPRLVGRFHTAPSSVEDYYNPLARIALPPLELTVNAGD